MKKTIQLSIPTPCHENWDAMTPETKGRFCALCQKTVIDFTKLSDREIASILKSNKNTCGRFKGNQLDRELVIPKEKSSLWMAASAAVFSFLTIGNNTVSAQTPVNTEQIDLKIVDIIGDTIVVPRPYKIVKGVVLEDKIPLPGVSIKNISNNKTTTTDFDGNFSIKAITGDNIEISFIGMQTKTIEIKNGDEGQIINVKLEGYFFGKVIIERTFFGRIFHSIGSIFR